MKKLVILDRDGVINHDSDEFIKSPQEWRPIAGSLEAIARLCHAGYRVVIATNQSGIGRQLYSMDVLAEIHNKMLRLTEQVGGHIEAIFFCPHAPREHCDCRKPKPGLYLEISRRFNTPLTTVSIIGDSLRDLQAATSVQCAALSSKNRQGGTNHRAISASQPHACAGV